jgi:RimJ/RimL family protein N-acetyltransferase
MVIQIGDDYVIRDWRENDAAGIVKYANNRNISKNLRDGFPYPYGLLDAERFLSVVKQQDPRTYFAIATDSEVIGGIGVGLREDVHRLTAEMGFWLAEPYWGKGIMTEAVKRFTEYAFERYGLLRIFAEPYATNPASARVLEKAGYTLEGIMRANVFKEGEVLDQYLYARVREPE